MLESELRGARVFVDEFKAPPKNSVGINKGQAETDTAGRDRTAKERVEMPRSIGRLVVALTLYGGAL